MIQLLTAVVRQGHGVASGQSVGQADNPYPRGTIAMQAPFFKQLGLSLSGLQLATLNLDIAPRTWTLHKADYCFEHLEWTHLHPPETFSFVAVEAQWQDAWYKGWIYHPHAETKAMHFQSKSTIELIVPLIKGIQYGSQIALRLDASKVKMT
jgi:hypothetical protein